MEKGKSVHEARAKVKSIYNLMHRAGKLEEPNLETLAGEAKLKLGTLRNAINVSRFTVATETALVEFVGFDPEEVTWVDRTIDDPTRENDCIRDYHGKDTALAFHDFLLRHLSLGTTGAAVRSSSSSEPKFVDRHLLCHHIDLVRNSAPGAVDVQLQSHFGHRFDDDGNRYVIRKAQFELTILCDQGRAIARLGHPEPFRTGNAVFEFSGTDKLPSWGIQADNDETSRLYGVYEIREALVVIARCRPDAQLHSRMRINVFDGGLVPDEAKQFTAGKRNIIDALFTKELMDLGHDKGWVTLSEHDVPVSEAQ